MFQNTFSAPFFRRFILGLLVLAAAPLALLPGACSGRSKADKLHTEGVILAKNHQYLPAIAKFDAALKLQPDRIDTLVESAEIYLKTENFDQAIQKADKALTLAPANAGAYLILGQAHLALARKPASELGGAPTIDPAEMAKAVETAATLRKVKPDSTEGTLLQARIDQMNGKLDSAFQLFRTVLDQSSGKNSTALLGATEVQLARKNYAEAEKLARQALDLEKPANPTALDDLAISLALQDRFDDAYDILAPHITDKDKQPQVTHYLLAGRILLTQLDREGTTSTTAAISTATSATAAATRRPVQRLADLGRAMKGFFPKLPDSFFFRAVSYQLQNDIPKAITDFENACLQAPREKRFRMALVLAQMTHKNYPVARQELRTLLRDNPGDRDGRLRLAQCYALEGSYDEAIDLLRNLALDQPANTTYKEALGKVLVLTAEPPKVKEGMALLASIPGADAQAPGNSQLMLAEAALAESEKLSAAGKLAESDARFLDAERLLDEAARLQPKSTLPQLKLSELAVRRGDLVSGLAHARLAAALDPQLAALEARIYARLGQPAAARARYATLLAGSANALGYQLAIADLDIQLGRASEAAQALDALIAKYPGDPRPYLHRALLLGRPAEVEAAIKFLKEHLAKNPDNLSERLGLAQIQIKARRLPDAVATLDETAALVQNKITALRSQKGLEAAAAEAATLRAQLTLKLALAELLTGKADSAARHAAGIPAQEPALAPAAALVQAAAALARNDAPQSRLALESTSLTLAQAPAVGALLASLTRLKGGDAPGAADLVRAAKAIAPGTQAAYARMLSQAPPARLAASVADLALLTLLTQYPDFAPDATALADRLLQALPGEPFVRGLKADILQSAGNIEAALAELDQIRQAAPEITPVLLAQADLYMMLAEQARPLGRQETAKNNSFKAAEACRAAIQRAPANAEAYEKLGMILQLSGQTDEANLNFRKVIEIDPGRGSAYNNLAWNLAEAKKLDEAARMGEKALAAAPTDGGVLDTMGWIELQRNHLDRAVTLLSQASLRLPNNPDVRFHLAQAFQRKADKDRALAELEGIALATPQFGRISEVRDLIRQLNPQSEILKNSSDGSSPNPTIGAGLK